jgi:hypothetical protein
MAERVTLPIDRIVTEGTQARNALSETIMREYAEAMTNGDEFPPIDVYFDDTAYWLADGFHRVRAAKTAGQDTITARVHPGSKREAILHAVHANETHGHRRTDADRRRAVTLMLSDPEWWSWSDREIARQCHVSHMLVNRMRREITPPEETRTPAQTRKAKRGHQTYAIHTGKIGRAKQSSSGPPHTGESKPPEPHGPGGMPASSAMPDAARETPSVTVLQMHPEVSTLVAASQEPTITPVEPSHEHDEHAPSGPEVPAPAAHEHPAEPTILPSQPRLMEMWQQASDEEQKAFVATYREALQALLAALQSPDDTHVQPKTRASAGSARPRHTQRKKQPTV